ncbi:MAG: DUF2059 domain-containing protein [Halieaceae bacterium]
MNKMLLACACVLLSLQVFAAEPATQTETETETSAKRALVERLLDQTGQSAATIGQQYADLFIQQLTMILKQGNPNIDPRAFNILQEEVRTVIQEEFVNNSRLSDVMYPIYTAHFSTEDLQQMIAFNETRLGKKLIKVMPLVTQESMVAGQEFGEMLGPMIQDRLVKRFEEEGIQ